MSPLSPLALAALLAACSPGAQPKLTPVPTSPQSTPNPVVAATLPTASPEPTPKPSAAAGFVLVALGDSIPGGLNCDDPCKPYPVIYGEEVAAAINEAVDVRNLATNDSLTSTRLFTRLADPGHVKAIADADLVTVQIGFNDFQGPCTWMNHAMCLADGERLVATNIKRILSAIRSIRDERPVAIRVLTYYDNFLGDGRTPGVWNFEPTEANIDAFAADYGSALRSFNAMLCAAADAAGAICVDLVVPFNGPEGDKPAAELISDDGIHPSAAGHLLIAQTLADAGLDDLTATGG